MKKILLFLSLTVLYITQVWAITLTVPPSDGNQDIMVTWPTQVNAKADIITTYIQLVNKYLWFAMVVFLFALVVWMWFQIMTNEAGSDNAKKVLKNWLMSAGTGIGIILLSYTIVRIVVNLL